MWRVILPHISTALQTVLDRVVKMNVSIEEWQETHPSWPVQQQVIVELVQTAWVDPRFAWHLATTMLVALHDGNVVGFLRFMTQLIGSEDD